MVLLSIPSWNTFLWAFLIKKTEHIEKNEQPQCKKLFRDIRLQCVYFKLPVICFLILHLLNMARRGCTQNENTFKIDRGQKKLKKNLYTVCRRIEKNTFRFVCDIKVFSFWFLNSMFAPRGCIQGRSHC